MNGAGFHGKSSGRSDRLNSRHRAPFGDFAATLLRPNPAVGFWRQRVRNPRTAAIGAAGSRRIDRGAALRATPLQQFAADRAVRAARLRLRPEKEAAVHHIRDIRKTMCARTKNAGTRGTRGGRRWPRFGDWERNLQQRRDLFHRLLCDLGELPSFQHADRRLLAAHGLSHGALGHPLFAPRLSELSAKCYGKLCHVE